MNPSLSNPSGFGDCVVTTEGGIFYTDQHAPGQDEDEQTAGAIPKHLAQRTFADFLRNFREHSADELPLYRAQLDHDPPPPTLNVNIDDLISHDRALAEALRSNPGEYLPLVRKKAIGRSITPIWLGTLPTCI